MMIKIRGVKTEFDWRYMLAWILAALVGLLLLSTADYLSEHQRLAGGTIQCFYDGNASVSEKIPEDFWGSQMAILKPNYIEKDGVKYYCNSLVVSPKLRG